MTRLLKFGLPIVFVLAAVGISMLLVKSRPQAIQKPVDPPSLLVEVEVAQRRFVTFEVSTQGVVAPRTQTTLVSEVAGQIVEVSDSFVSGGFFAAGDELLHIDPRNYESQFKRARAAVARAETQVATENALAGYAFEDWKRLRAVDGRSSPASDLTLRKPQLAQALAELESAEAELEKAEEDLNRTVIRAPYDGMVREKLADVGQFVNIGAQLARTFATDYAEVRLPLTQHDLEFLDLAALSGGRHLPVELRADIGGEVHHWQALVVRSEGVFDAQSRVLHVVARVPRPYETEEQRPEPLRIGTFVTATIEGRPGGDLFRVPRHALQRGETLWVVDDQSRIQPRRVNIVRSDERYVYIDDGLEDGLRFCITPIDQPLPGMRVRFNG